MKKVWIFVRVLRKANSLQLIKQLENLVGTSIKSEYAMIGSTYGFGNAVNWDYFKQHVIAGKIDAVLLDSVKRISRDPKEQEEFINFCNKHSVQIIENRVHRKESQHHESVDLLAN